MATGGSKRDDRRDEVRTAAPSKTRRVLGFFKPDLGTGPTQVREVHSIFLQILASLFASVNILSPKHPYLQPGARFTLGELFATTLARIDWKDKRQLPQTVFFCAVWGLLASTVLYAITAVLLFVATPSHAYAEDTQPAAAASDSGGMFDIPDKEKDLAQQFLHNLVEGQPVKAIQDQNTQGGSQQLVNTGLFQSAFRDMLKYYSSVILIIASFMVLYHIIMLIVNSAWSGKPLEGANQIWGPLRLAIAIGLLVPLSGGLNSGQFMVLKIAEVGSIAGTKAWNVFTSSLADNAKDMQIPLNDQARDEFVKMILVYACVEDINLHANKEYISTVTNEGTTKFTDYFGNPQCGIITLPGAAADSDNYALIKDNQSNNATVMQQLSANIVLVTQDESKKLQTKASDIAKRLVETQAQHEGWKKPDGTDLISQDKGDFEPIKKDIQKAIYDYYEGIGSRLSTIINKNKSWNFLQNSSWILAGAYYMQLSAFQHIVYTSAENIATTELGPVFARKQDDRGSVARFFGINGEHVASLEEEHFVKQIGRYAEQVNGAVFDNAAKSGFATAQNAVSNNIVNSQSAATKAPLYMNPMTAPMVIGSDAGGYLSKAFNMDKYQLLKVFQNNIEDPFAAFVETGHLIFSWGKTAFLVSLGAMVGSGVATYFGPIGGAISGVIDKVVSIVIPISFYMISLGGLLAILLPLVPVVKFLGGVITWMLAVMEAVIGMPLFALAHLTPGGQGLLDPARQGYIMLFHIAIRPILLIFGMIVAIIIVSLALFLLNAMFLPAMNSAWQPGDGGLILAIIMLSIWAYTAYNIVKKVFSFMDYISHSTMRWLGSDGYRFERYQGEGNAYAAAAAFGQASDAFQKIAGGIGGLVPRAKKDPRPKQGVTGKTDNGPPTSDPEGPTPLLPGPDGPQPPLLPGPNGPGPKPGPTIDGGTLYLHPRKTQGIPRLNGPRGSGPNGGLPYNPNGPDFDSGPRNGPGGGNGRGGSIARSAGFTGYDKFSDDHKLDSASHYSALGLNRGASEEDVKKAWKKAARQNHPDRFEPGSSQQILAKGRMQELNFAKDSLLGNLRRSGAGLNEREATSYNTNTKSSSSATTGMASATRSSTGRTVLAALAAPALAAGTAGSGTEEKANTAAFTQQAEIKNSSAFTNLVTGLQTKKIRAGFAAGWTGTQSNGYKSGTQSISYAGNGGAGYTQAVDPNAGIAASSTSYTRGSTSVAYEGGTPSEIEPTGGLGFGAATAASGANASQASAPVTADMANAYSALNLSPSATQEEVTSAFRAQTDAARYDLSQHQEGTPQHAAALQRFEQSSQSLSRANDAIVNHNGGAAGLLSTNLGGGVRPTMQAPQPATPQGMAAATSTSTAQQLQPQPALAQSAQPLRQAGQSALQTAAEQGTQQLTTPQGVTAAEWADTQSGGYKSGAQNIFYDGNSGAGYTQAVDPNAGIAASSTSYARGNTSVSYDGGVPNEIEPTGGLGFGAATAASGANASQASAPVTADMANAYSALNLPQSATQEQVTSAFQAQTAAARYDLNQYQEGTPQHAAALQRFEQSSQSLSCANDAIVNHNGGAAGLLSTNLGGGVRPTMQAPQPQPAPIPQAAPGQGIQQPAVTQGMTVATEPQVAQPSATSQGVTAATSTPMAQQPQPQPQQPLAQQPQPQPQQPLAQQPQLQPAAAQSAQQPNQSGSFAPTVQSNQPIATPQGVTMAAGPQVQPPLAQQPQSQQPQSQQPQPAAAQSAQPPTQASGQPAPQSRPQPAAGAAPQTPAAPAQSGGRPRQDDGGLADRLNPKPPADKG